MHTSYANEDLRPDTPIGYSETQFIKLYDSVLDDMEIQSMPPQQFRFLINCWLLARRSGACLGTPQQIAFKIRISASESEAFCQDMPGYLTKRPDGKYEVRNWSYWQSTKTSTDRSRESRRRKKQADATNATTATLHALHATTATLHAADATLHDLQKKRKEKKREEDAAAVAAARAVPEPPTRPQQQPEFLPFGDEPDVQHLVSESVEHVAQFWPMLGNVPNAKRVWERHASAAVEGPEAWCQKIRNTAMVHSVAHEQCRRANARHFIPSLEKWVQDNDYARPAPRVLDSEQQPQRKTNLELAKEMLGIQEKNHAY